MEVYKGRYLVVWMNGRNRVIDLDGDIRDAYGHPIAVIGTDGTHYPWINIQSLKKE